MVAKKRAPLLLVLASAATASSTTPTTGINRASFANDDSARTPHLEQVRPHYDRIVDHESILERERHQLGRREQATSRRR